MTPDKTIHFLELNILSRGPYRKVPRFTPNAIAKIIPPASTEVNLCRSCRKGLAHKPPMVAKGNEKHNAIAKIGQRFRSFKTSKKPTRDPARPSDAFGLSVKLFLSSISFQIKKLENNEAIARRTKVPLKPRVSKDIARGAVPKIPPKAPPTAMVIAATVETRSGDVHTTANK